MHLIEDPEAQLALDEAVECWAGTQVAWEAITWAVVHDTELGKPLTDDGMIRAFTYDGARSIQQPTITVVYEIIGKRQVVIRRARFTEAKYGQSGTA